MMHGVRPIVGECDDIARRLSDDIDGELSIFARLYIRLHVLTCPACMALRESLLRTVMILRRLPEVDRGQP